ncbi:DNA processing protein DprA [Methylobacterium sp. 77]|uniref:DNA processing protein DprA n=1 Tax=Methylobacterium sp. 77 TaxID=1101192 RepID=UPI00037C5629|nr:DNA processing protein DprA [Methylobacterium sp. 77]
MTRADVIARLSSLEPRLRSSGVDALYLFGSHARDEAGAGSDVDVFVDPIDENAFSLTEYSATYDVIEDALPGVEIGYSTRDGLVPVYRAHIERDAIRIF